jgi:4-hydroxybenzoate polyprenyltransferase
VRVLSRLRGAPWLSGALLLVLAGALLAPAVYYLGLRRWPLYVGLLAGLVLFFGAIETAWRSRPLPRLRRPVGRGRFRVVAGGKDKGNGHAHDVPERPDDDGDKPRWVM